MLNWTGDHTFSVSLAFFRAFENPEKSSAYKVTHVRGPYVLYLKITVLCLAFCLLIQWCWFAFSFLLCWVIVCLLSIGLWLTLIPVAFVKFCWLLLEALSHCFFESFTSNLKCYPLVSSLFLLFLSPVSSVSFSSSKNIGRCKSNSFLSMSYVELLLLVDLI